LLLRVRILSRVEPIAKRRIRLDHQPAARTVSLNINRSRWTRVDSGMVPRAAMTSSGRPVAPSRADRVTCMRRWP